jgi:hypothetical protein
VAKRPTFTPDQLQIGGNHVLYDVQMLCNNAALLEEESRWTTDGTTRRCIWLRWSPS